MVPAESKRCTTCKVSINPVSSAEASLRKKGAPGIVVSLEVSESAETIATPAGDETSGNRSLSDALKMGGVHRMMLRAAPIRIMLFIGPKNIFSPL
jgi:hypothetical protein